MKDTRTTAERREYHHDWYLKNRERLLAHQAEYRKAYPEKIRAKRNWFNEYRSHCQCVECGESDPVCIDFHHLNPDEKEGCIGDYVNLTSTKFLIELEKCIPLCANCHRKLHRNNGY